MVVLQLGAMAVPFPVFQGHGMCLSASDLDRITIFISEMCIRGLMPHVERQMRALSDVVSGLKWTEKALDGHWQSYEPGGRRGVECADSLAL